MRARNKQKPTCAIGFLLIFNENLRMVVQLLDQGSLLLLNERLFLL